MGKPGEKHTRLMPGRLRMASAVSGHPLAKYQMASDQDTVRELPVKSLLFMSKQLSIRTEMAFSLQQLTSSCSKHQITFSH